LAGNELGDALTVAEAEERIFGVVILNDWSARDIQAWEYVPLGPFLAKNFATSVSPWIVTLDALETFRCATSTGAQAPAPLAYLADPAYATAGSFDLALDVALQGAAWPAPAVIARSNFKHMYWNFRQQLVHHTASGCNLNAGDLLGSGTISGATPDSRGSMLELSWKGETPLAFANGEKRAFLADGDTVIMTGACADASTGVRIDFGEVRGTVLPARAPRA